MQLVITHPRGVAAGAGTEEAKAEYDMAPGEIERLVAPSSSLSGLDRISIYAEMYVLRLHDVLREDYPVLLHALGERRFEALARDYIAAHPSRHPNLNQFGRHLAEFVASRDDRHAGFLFELATLERAASEAFDAAREVALGRAELESLGAEQWAGLSLRLVPSARLLAFRHPVNRYYVDVKEGRKSRIPKPAPSYTLVYRKDWIVWRANLSREQHALLSELAGGAALGTALEACSRRSELDAAKLQQGLVTWFREWSAEGIFRSIT
jgi:hypothetical protein